MKYSEKCTFCNETRFINNELANLPTEEAILFENEDLFVRVDISPVCLGHILIVTNKHYLNFFEIPKNMKKQVEKLQNKIKKIYKEVYNSDVLFFEHGSAQSGYAGASIDHAHLHCVPYKFDMVEDLNRTFGRFRECNIITSDEKFDNDFSYLYIQNTKENKGRVYTVEKLPSQFLRKLCFEKQGIEGYKWQEKCTNSDSVYNQEQTITDLTGKIFI